MREILPFNLPQPLINIRFRRTGTCTVAGGIGGSGNRGGRRFIGGGRERHGNHHILAIRSEICGYLP